MFFMVCSCFYKRWLSSGAAFGAMYTCTPLGAVSKPDFLAMIAYCWFRYLRCVGCSIWRKSIAYSTNDVCLPEHILIFGPQQLFERTFPQRIRESAHVHNRRAFGGLAHDQRGRGSQFVCSAQDGDLQFAPGEIRLAAQVYHAGQAAQADGG